MKYFSFTLFFLMFFYPSIFFGQDAAPSSPPLIGVSESPKITYPFIGKILKADVNIRSGNGTQYDILGKTRSNQEVIVWNEIFDWYEITPPEEVFFWVYSTFVTQGVIAGSGVNVRVRPNLDAYVICQLEYGDTVQVVTSLDEWVQIKPPSKAHVWIHKDFIQHFKSYDDYQNELDAGGDSERLEEEKAKGLQDAENFEQEEFLKPLDQIHLDAIIQKYQDLLVKYPEDSNFETLIESKIAHTKEKMEVSSKVALLQVEPTESIAQETPLIPVPSGTASEDSEKISALDFQGRLEVAGGIGRWSRHYKLIAHARRICILEGDSPDLEPFLHQEVKVKGKIISYLYKTIPVVQVVKIESLTLEPKNSDRKMEFDVTSWPS